VKFAIAPEAHDDVLTNIADVRGRDDVVPREAHDPHERRAERHIPEMADVKFLVCVQLGVLNHHTTGDRRAASIVIAYHANGLDDRADDFVLSKMQLTKLFWT
jgi:hypothetical protein